MEELCYGKNILKDSCYSVEGFINYYKDKELKEITDTLIAEFINYWLKERGVSTSYQNHPIYAIKFYYEKIVQADWKLFLIDRPRKEQKLMVVLNESEIRALIEWLDNIKHIALVMLGFSSRLRLEELVNLKLET